MRPEIALQVHHCAKASGGRGCLPWTGDCGQRGRYQEVDGDGEEEPVLASPDGGCRRALVLDQ